MQILPSVVVFLPKIRKADPWIYDDQRIFGEVLGGTQQGLNHDAAIFKYAIEKFQIDLGLAYSQDVYDNPSGFQLVGTAL